MFGNLTGWHLVILLAIVLLLFGAPKLPGLARSIGQSMRIFRSEVRTMKDENGDTVVVDDAAADTAADEPSAAKPASKPAASKPAKPKD
jgi:sec-independent protein translocase protein TatA